MNFNIKNLIVPKDYSIKKALKMIDEGAKGIVFIVDYNESLIGTVTDGDIRRAILNDVQLNEEIGNIMHINPIRVKREMSRDEIKDIFIKKAIQVIPIVDNNNKVIDMITINDILLPCGKENKVIIMAGGLGTRLKNLTKEIPKPMLKVGNEPMLKHIMNNFKQYGYNKILLSVNYKSEIIENYFQDGFAYGVKIDYIKESKRMGTAGGIKLAERYVSDPFFVINGDVFTNLNVESMMNFHLENKFDITVGTRRHSFQIPYGVINTNENVITSIEEKPTINYLINAGIYCLNTEVIKFIPDDEYFEITDLINKCIKMGLKVGSYEIRDYWMDIGHLDEYNKVNEDVYDLLAYDKVGEKFDK
ncbi:CBS domain-containing protein [Clostridium botulinum]|uniref:nucleotidyltransferase family protein n=1 Tax=Clostridium botulinum TaxID=1491 RepID=UPI001C9B5C84|nr:nucleotidyltransferase family protein [Clostridium botulinum]MBY7023865.1 CBS domain-containing protein [Clostridium botulinum]